MCFEFGFTKTWMSKGKGFEDSVVGSSVGRQTEKVCNGRQWV